MGLNPTLVAYNDREGVWQYVKKERLIIPHPLHKLLKQKVTCRIAKRYAYPAVQQELTEEHNGNFNLIKQIKYINKLYRV